MPLGLDAAARQQKLLVLGAHFFFGDAQLLNGGRQLFQGVRQQAGALLGGRLGAAAQAVGARPGLFGGPGRAPTGGGESVKVFLRHECHFPA